MVEFAELETNKADKIYFLNYSISLNHQSHDFFAQQCAPKKENAASDTNVWFRYHAGGNSHSGF